MPKRVEKLGQKLRAHRKATGLTLEQLSNLAGVSKAMLSQIEQNKINPTVAIILKISDALNISITDLIEDTARKNILRVHRAGGVMVDELEHLVFIDKIRQARHTAFVSTATESNHDLRFPSKKFCHVEVIIVTDSAVEEATIDLAIFKSEDIRFFKVHCDGPEYDNL